MTSTKVGKIKKIVFITLDSVRADRISIFNYSKDTTHNLRYMCKNTNCFATIARANAPYTKAAFKSIMAGLLRFQLKHIMRLKVYRK